MSVEISHQASINKMITKAVEDFLGKFKGNSDRMFARYFFWTVIERYAKAQKETAFNALLEGELVEKDHRALPKGDHTIGTSPGFFILDKVSAPRKTFDDSVLAQSLKKKYKVPLPVTKELVEAAKIEGNPTHTIAIVERQG
jgi:hypothetical protein